MNEPIRRITLAERAQEAAAIAASTLVHEPNPYEEGSDDFREYAASYQRFLKAAMGDEESSA